MASQTNHKSSSDHRAKSEAPVIKTAAEADAPEVTAIPAGTWPSPIDGFRQAVAGVPLVGLIAVGDEKTPYPSGTQLGAGKRFWLQNGYYKSATPT
jgi:hypothetical protein